MHILYHVQQVVNLDNSIEATVVDLPWVVVFYLLPPDEYEKLRDNHPLSIKHISLQIGYCKLSLLSCQLYLIELANNSSLIFNNQKNQERGKIVANSTSSYWITYPTRSLAYRNRYLCQHITSTDTYIPVIKINNKQSHMTSKFITSTLKSSAFTLSHLRFWYIGVTVHSMQQGVIWCYHAVTWTPTPFTLWIDKNPTPCFVTCTLKLPH